MGKLEFNNLKDDIKSQNIKNFYIFHGVEHYNKSFFISKISDSLIDGAFKSFNLEVFDEFSFNIESFESAIESYPAMSERKLIIVNDVDIFGLKSDIKDSFLQIISDLPDYICLIFNYTTLEYKPDGRVKLGQIIKKKATVVEFEFLDMKDLKPWVLRRFRVFKLDIDNKTLDYLIFICGMSMANLANETEKLNGYCTKSVSMSDIDFVCTKALDAKIFDVTEKIIAGEILKAFEMVDDLIKLKNEEISILAVINSQFQRFYLTRIALNQGKNANFIADFIGLRSYFAVDLTIKTTQKLDISYLRGAVNLCAAAAVDMVSKNIEKAEIIKLLIIKIGDLHAKN